jgi:hypothetical protein
MRPALVSRASPRVRASRGPRVNSAKAGTREGRREDAPERAHGGDRARCRIIPIHNVKQRSLLRSRGALLRPGSGFLFSIRPMRGKRSAERRSISVVALSGATIRACRGAARVQRDALASRRSTVAILGRGPRFLLRHFLRISAASSSQPGRNAWRAGSRTSRGLGYEPRPQDATPRSAFGTSPETAPQMSEDARTLLHVRTVVNP